MFLLLACCCNSGWWIDACVGDNGVPQGGEGAQAGAECQHGQVLVARDGDGSGGRQTHVARRRSVVRRLAGRLARTLVAGRRRQRVHCAQTLSTRFISSRTVLGLI